MKKNKLCFLIIGFVLFTTRYLMADTLSTKDFTYIKTGKLRKYIMDTAVTDKYVFVLCMFYKNKTDAIVKLDRKTGRRISVQLIGKYRAAAIESTNNALWVISRRRRAFLRKISYNGKTLLKIKIDKMRFGTIYGLAINNNTIYFSATKNSESTVYSYDLKSKAFSKLYTVPERIYSLTFLNGKLYAYQRRKGIYSYHWLIINDIKTGKSKRIHFLHRSTWGLANHGNNLFILYRKRKRAVVHPFYVKEKQNLVLGRFIRKRVTAIYKIRNKNRNPYKIRLWLPFPISDKFNKIENLKIIPKPLKTVTDKFGNKWLYYNFSRLKGNKYVTYKFTYTFSSHTSTLDENYFLKQSDIPPNIRKKYLKPTYNFDYNHPIVKRAFSKIESKIRNYTLIKKIVAIHNFTNDIIIKDRASGGLKKASGIIKFRYGRCYYHTVLFATFLRLAGIPARVIGGHNIKNSPHAWNQVYFPGTGWIDVDTTRDDNEKTGKHYTSNIASRRGNANYMITFIGSLDKRDFKNVFACRGWRMTYRWSSLNRYKRARVRVRLSVKSY